MWPNSNSSSNNSNNNNNNMAATFYSVMDGGVPSNGVNVTHSSSSSSSSSFIPVQSYSSGVGSGVGPSEDGSSSSISTSHLLLHHQQQQQHQLSLLPPPPPSSLPSPDDGDDVISDLLLSRTETSIIGAVLVFVFIASLIANSFVFVVFCKRKSLTLSDRFVANLTVCNCLNTLLVMPFAFVSILAKTWVFGPFWCLCTGFLMNVIVAASIFTLAVISIDRYFAVVTPLHYGMRLTSRRCLAMIAVIWSAAVLVACPPLMGWNYIQFQPSKMVCTVKWSSTDSHHRIYTFFLISFTFILPLIAMLWTYAKIFRAARNNSVRTRKNSVIRVHATPTPPLQLGTGESRAEKLQHQQQTTPINGRRRSSSLPIIRRFSQSSGRTSSFLWRMEEWKTALTSFIVLFSFALCWMPYFVVIGVEAVTGTQRPFTPLVSLFSTATAMFSCACNPLVYVFRSKVVRTEFSRIVRCRQMGNGQEICVPHDFPPRRTSVVRNESGRSLKSLDEVMDESGTLPNSTTASTLAGSGSNGSIKR